MSLNPGTRFGCYAITEPIAAGGMGEVYRARDTELGRDVAIKVLPASFTSDAARVARFEQEAKTLAALNHPNIAHIYGLERSGGTAALVMELVDGPTLVERIVEGPIPVDEALALASQIAGALEAAHERGIVHRDLKPANIKLKPNSTIKVLDFGIAKALNPKQVSGPAALTTPAMTEAGYVLGTAAYMSPEQARGKAVDQRTDVWAFGAVLYEMLTGKPAFLGEDVTSTLARVLEVPPDWNALPARVPNAVRRTLELCLEKDARKRMADVRDVRLALTGAFAPQAAVQPLWRRALPYAATLLLGAVIAGGYVASSRQSGGPLLPAAALPVSRFVITPPATAPLADLAGLDLAISPDGQRIAYFAFKPNSESVELYVRDLDALEARVIPDTEVLPQPSTMNPFFSPDGRSIGFFAVARGVVSVAATDVRPTVKIIDRPAPAFVGATWAPDNTIVYSSGLELHRVAAGGGGTPQTLLPERTGRGALAPVLLPDGRGVVFHSVENGVDRVGALNLETGQEKILIEAGSNPAYLDTGHLVFVRGDTLMAAPFDAAELAVTGESVALIQGIRRPTGGAADYALSANGTLAYIPRQDTAVGDASLVWVDRNGNVVGRAVRDVLAAPRDLRLSPDGKRVLIVVGREGDGDLWNYDLGGRPAIPLALPGDNRFPVWSPDGQSVAFLQIAGAPALSTIRSDGSMLTPQRIRAATTVNAPGAPHEWLADGTLVVTTGPAAPDVSTLSGDWTGALRPSVASDYRENDPTLSPNGRWLAYVSDRTGREEIWVQEFPEGVAVRVSSTGGYEPQWSADGRELFFRAGDAMMAVTVETGDEFSFATPQRLFSGPYQQRAAPTSRGYAVARDGRFLMTLLENQSAASPSASIVVVQNFGEEIKRATRTGP
jgi:Tol biopolymer transport system component